MVYKSIRKYLSYLGVLRSFGVHLENWWLNVSSTFQTAVLGWALFILFMNRKFSGTSKTRTTPGGVCHEKGLYTQACGRADDNNGSFELRRLPPSTPHGLALTSSLVLSQATSQAPLGKKTRARVELLTPAATVHVLEHEAAL